MVQDRRIFPKLFLETTKDCLIHDSHYISDRATGDSVPAKTAALLHQLELDAEFVLQDGDRLTLIGFD